MTNAFYLWGHVYTWRHPGGGWTFAFYGNRSRNPIVAAYKDGRRVRLSARWPFCR